MGLGFFKKKKSKQDKPMNDHYYNLKVINIIKETADAITIVFAMPEEKIEYESGQFLTLIQIVNGKEVRRSYSFCTSPYVDENIAVTIKRVEGGLMSNYLPDHLAVNDTLRVMEPMGTFTTKFDIANKRHIVMFAGGSGITPMMSIIKSLLTQEPDSVTTLIYCNRDIDSIIFKDQFDQLQTTYEGRLRVIHILDNAPMNWQGHSGLLNHEMLTKVFERMPNWGIEKTTYLMCGPEGMMNNVETLLEKQNVPKDRIFKESFVSGTIKKDQKEATESQSEVLSTREVTIRYDGEEHKITVTPDSTILETALDNGIDLPYSCQSGLCTACRGKCLSGKVKLDEEEGLSEQELEEGYVLTCVGHPMSDDVIIEIG